MGLRAPAAAVLVLALTGCGDSATRVGDLRVTGEVRPEYDHRPSPPGGPARGISGVAFADRSLGVGIADGETDVGVGQLQVTNDGGNTWRTVFRGAHVGFDDVEFVGRSHIVALAEVPVPNQSWNAKPLVLRSDDEGRTWRRFAPQLPAAAGWPLSLSFVTPSLGFAVAPAGGGFERIWLLRTTDGGHSWRSVRRPPDAGNAVSSVDFVDRRTGYATSPRRCGAGLFRTDDGGATWQGVPGSCIPGVRAYSVDFIDRRRGFLAGGSLKRRVLLSTTDGGRTWTKRSSEPTGLESWIRVEFDPAGRAGWGLRGSCDPYHPPCALLPGLWRTTDGGSMWQRQRLPYVGGFDALDATHVWATGSAATAGGILWRTTNGGRSWTRLAGSRGLAPNSVSFAGSRVILDTDGGFLESTDSGRSWRWLDVRFPRGSSPTLATVRPDRSLVPSEDGRWIWLRADSNQRWRQVRLPVDYPSAIAFADLRTGIVGSDVVAYTTSDGGQSWTRRRLPFDAGDELTLSAAPGLITESDGFDGRRFGLSSDGGVTWRIVQLPRGYRNVGVRPGRDHTLLLSTERAGHGSELYLSFDGGKTWKRTRGSLPTQIAQEGNEAWGVEEDPDKHLLWHTTDGGRHWTEVWPRPPVTR